MQDEYMSEIDRMLLFVYMSLFLSASLLCLGLLLGTHHTPNGIGKEIYQVWLPFKHARSVKENSRALIHDGQGQIKSSPDLILSGGFQPGANTFVDC